MSSRIAAWGQPPVSTARMRSVGSASFRTRNSASSRVKMSLVTTPRLIRSRSSRHSASTSAVFPLPTGPPTPTVNARSRVSRRIGRSRWWKWPGVVGVGVVAFVAHVAVAPSGLEQPRVQPIVRGVEEVEQRRRLGEVVHTEGSRSGSATASSAGPSRAEHPLRLVGAHQARAARRRRAPRARCSRGTGGGCASSQRHPERPEHHAPQRREVQAEPVRAPAAPPPGRRARRWSRNAPPCVRLARLATWLARNTSARASSRARARPGPASASRASGSAAEAVCQSAARVKAPRSSDLAGLGRGLEPARVREATGGERRVGELQQCARTTIGRQKSEYRWASGRVRAGSQRSSTPSARTS